MTRFYTLSIIFSVVLLSFPVWSQQRIKGIDDLCINKKGQAICHVIRKDTTYKGKKGGIAIVRTYEELEFTYDLLVKKKPVKVKGKIVGANPLREDYEKMLNNQPKHIDLRDLDNDDLIVIVIAMGYEKRKQRVSLSALQRDDENQTINIPCHISSGLQTALQTQQRDRGTYWIIVFTKEQLEVSSCKTWKFTSTATPVNAEGEPQGEEMGPDPFLPPKEAFAEIIR